VAAPWISFQAPLSSERTGSETGLASIKKKEKNTSGWIGPPKLQRLLRSECHWEVRRRFGPGYGPS